MRKMAVNKPQRLSFLSASQQEIIGQILWRLSSFFTDLVYAELKYWAQSRTDRKYTDIIARHDNCRAGNITFGAHSDQTVYNDLTASQGQIEICRAFYTTAAVALRRNLDYNLSSKLQRQQVYGQLYLHRLGQMN